MNNDEWIKEEFAVLKGMIMKLDESIRGNGKEGLLVRVVKNEQRHKLLLWILASEAMVLCGLIGRLVYNYLSQPI